MCYIRTHPSRGELTHLPAPAASHVGELVSLPLPEGAEASLVIRCERGLGRRRRSRYRAAGGLSAVALPGLSSTREDVPSSFRQTRKSGACACAPGRAPSISTPALGARPLRRAIRNGPRVYSWSSRHLRGDRAQGAPAAPQRAPCDLLSAMSSAATMSSLAPNCPATSPRSTSSTGSASRRASCSATCSCRWAIQCRRSKQSPRPGPLSNGSRRRSPQRSTERSRASPVSPARSCCGNPPRRSKSGPTSMAR